MSIIISKDGKDAQRVSPSSFDKEDYLQQYITNNPDAVPVYEIDEDIRLLILAREYGTNSGPIDALGIDQNGNIYLIETKLYKNSDKRTVMAQVLDYGAALWASSLDFTEFKQKLDDHVRKQFDASLQEKVQDFFDIDETEYQAAMDTMQSNLNSGRFKFIVLMDELHDRLKDLIRFINRNSQFDTYAVELDYYKHDEFEIIIPRMYGTEVKKEIGVKTNASGPRKQWSEGSFWQEVDSKLDADRIAGIRKIFDWSKQNADTINWGSGKHRGSFNPVFRHISPRSFVSIYTDGSIQVSYGYIEGDDELRKKLREALAKHLTIDGITNISDEKLNTWPSISPERVAENTDKIISALEEFIS